VGWHIALPSPAASTFLDDWRWARLFLGVAIVAADVAAGVAVVEEWPAAAVAWAAAIALVLACALGIWELARSRRPPAGRPPPDRAVLWTVLPATLIWAAPLLVASVVGHRLDPTLGADPGACTLWVAGNGGHALCTAVVIGFGEEYLYRGLLLVLAVKARLRHFGVAVINAGFGLWHVPDALSGSCELSHRLLGAVGVMAATFLLGQLILMPLRLRSRNVVAPALVHAGNNVLLNMF
jgi:membrane protease YdiL (CAAX protease family)